MAIFLLIPTLIRTVLVLFFKVDYFSSSILWLIIPDLIFLGISYKWLLLDKKIKLNIFSWLLLLVLLGFFIWDHNELIFVFHFFFPFLFFMSLNKEKFVEMNLVKMVMNFFTLLFNPFAQFLAFLKKKNPKENQEIAKSEVKNSQQELKQQTGYGKSIFIGLLLGVLIISILGQIDPSFKEFLDKLINFNLWEIVWKFIASYLTYYLLFFWYIANPTTAKWILKIDQETKLYKLIQWAIVMILTIVIGYTLYDGYILLRALHILKLTYESMGQNTQLYYLELVFLGGSLLFGSTHLLHKFFGGKNLTHKDQAVTKYLLISLLWLIPPIYNILRALLIVYIPEYGLTIKRLVGIYTTLAFILAFTLVIFNYFKKNRLIFVDSFLSFCLSLTLLVSILPNNLLIMNWHLNKYLQGENVDYEYLDKLNLTKWGFIFKNKIDPQTYITDNLIASLITNPISNKKAFSSYALKVVNEVETEEEKIAKTLEEGNFIALRTYLDETGETKYWIYNQYLPKSIKLNFDKTNNIYQFHEIKNHLQDASYETGDTEYYYYFDYYRLENFLSWHIPSFTLESHLYDEVRYHNLEIKYITKRSKNKLILIADSISPFVEKNLDQKCKQNESAKERSTISAYPCCDWCLDKYSQDRQGILQNNFVIPQRYLESYYACQFDEQDPNSCLMKYSKVPVETYNPDYLNQKAITVTP